MNKYRNILKESNPSFLSFSFGAFRFFLWHDFVLKNYQSVLPHFFHGRFRDLFFFLDPAHLPCHSHPHFLVPVPFYLSCFNTLFSTKSIRGYKYPSKRFRWNLPWKPLLTKAKKFFQLFFKNPLTKSKTCGIIYTQQKQRS